MKLKKFTPVQIKAFNPCSEYTIERITELWAGRKSLNALEMLDLPIKDADKVWVCFRPKVLPKPIFDKWLEVIVTRAVTNHALNCGVVKVEEWAKNWLSGEDRTANDADAAANAAYAAANDADAAANAAYAAANAAYAYAAYAANAAYAYAAYAAYAAANAERVQQVEDLRTILREEVETA